ncbi:MAG: hypothetical protein M1816_007331 [Peltula sp. TS41687]|nr:MAG: hypothetical protein M1816_007331 [Peltula sp. TS41687]
MGSVVVSDLVSTATRFPHTMLAGTASINRLPGAEPVYRASPGVSPDARPSTRSAHSIDTAASLERRPARSTPSNASHDAQRQPPVSTPTPVPCLRSNPQVVSNDSSSSEQRQTQHPGAPLTDHHGHATPPYDQPSSYTPSNLAKAHAPSPIPSAQTPLGGPSGPQRSGSPHCIRVRDLAHLHQLAGSAHHPSKLTLGTTYSPERGGDVEVKYEISGMPVSDVIEMVAGLLTKITTTNDRQHEHLHDHIPPPEETAGLSAQDSSVLAFHGRNIPTITILSYLTRIHRYCPTTYEVFLGLLVYFDRMTERVNAGSLHERNRSENPNNSNDTIAGGASSRSGGSSTTPTANYHPATPPSSASYEARERSCMSMSPIVPEMSFNADPSVTQPQFFVVDSFNIHRLVIAGVTCASKFFSDVFYTNSRYAKVGGLPLMELNHLEIQFLILNDFRLFVPVEELEAYGTMLVEFYLREVINNNNNQGHSQHQLEGSGATVGGMQTPTPP